MPTHRGEVFELHRGPGRDRSVARAAGLSSELVGLERIAILGYLNAQGNSQRRIVQWLSDLDQRESSAGRQREKQEERREKIVLGWLAHNRYRSAA